MPIYDDDNRIWVVAMFFTDPIACSSIEIKGAKAAMKSAWVKPEFRGQGIYNRMFEERLKIAKERGVKIITATTTEASKNTHLRHGFKLTGMRGRYYLFRKEIGNED
jgi:ribosomal protein S18 acetylase RimI-like enzyme